MNPVINFDVANRVFSRFTLSENCYLRNKPFLIRYTKRAKKELGRRRGRLIIEMQIYFSCLVQKRVLFHDSCEYEKVDVNNKLSIALRVIESDVCNPVVFAESHPERRELKTKSAEKMSAKELIFDYKKDGWVGNFRIG